MLKFFDNQQAYINFHIPNFLATKYDENDRYVSDFESFYKYDKNVLYFNNVGPMLVILLILSISYMMVNFGSEKQENNKNSSTFFKNLYYAFFKYSVAIDFLLASFSVFVSFTVFQLTQFGRAIDFLVSVVVTVFCIYFTGYSCVKIF